jgi:uncharacterized protein (TIGR02145 family)
LYSWYTVDTVSNGGKNVCPTNWHVPSDAEWTTLTTYLGGNDANKLKETGSTHWLYDYFATKLVTNESGFTALPGGYRHSVGTCTELGMSGNWWSSSESSLTSAWYRSVAWTGSSVSRLNTSKNSGFSVRCLKDN